MLLQVGATLVLDASAEEYAAAESLILCGVNRKQEICSVRKKLTGSCRPEEVQAAIEVAKTAASSLFQQLDHVTDVIIDDDRKFPDLPPIRVGLLA